MMITPRPPAPLDHRIRQLRTKPQLVDRVGEGVAAVDGAVEVVLEIVHVHVAVAEALARRKVEVANHLVDPDAAFDAATLAALRV